MGFINWLSKMLRFCLIWGQTGLTLENKGSFLVLDFWFLLFKQKGSQLDFKLICWSSELMRLDNWKLHRIIYYLGLRVLLKCWPYFLSPLVPKKTKTKSSEATKTQSNSIYKYTQWICLWIKYRSRDNKLQSTFNFFCQLEKTVAGNLT